MAITNFAQMAYEQLAYNQQMATLQMQSRSYYDDYKNEYRVNKQQVKYPEQPNNILLLIEDGL